MKRTLVAAILLWGALALPAAAEPLQAYIYAKCLTTYGKTVSAQKAAYYAPLIARVARKHHLPPKLLASLAWHESNFNPREVSPAGALGLAQVMPMWFRTYRVPLSLWRDPEANLDLAARIYCRYRTRMTLTYPGLSADELGHRTLVAYNMGPLAVSRGIRRSRYSLRVLRDTITRS